MRIKKIVIKSREAMHAEELVFAKKLDRGERVRAIRGEYFESLEAVRKILTDARLTLWRTIRDKKPDSISGLSQMVGRNFSDVHQDVSILVETGLVDLKKPKGARTRAIKPVSLVDQLEFKVA